MKPKLIFEDFVIYSLFRCYRVCKQNWFNFEFSWYFKAYFIFEILVLMVLVQIQKKRRANSIFINFLHTYSCTTGWASKIISLWTFTLLQILLKFLTTLSLIVRAQNFKILIFQILLTHPVVLSLGAKGFFNPNIIPLTVGDLADNGIEQRLHRNLAFIRVTKKAALHEWAGATVCLSAGRKKCKRVYTQLSSFYLIPRLGCARIKLARRREDAVFTHNERKV